MSTIGVPPLTRGTMRGLPAKSVVRPEGTSAFDPASIVGLAAVSSWPASSFGSAQMLPGPGWGAPEVGLVQVSEYWKVGLA